MGDDRTGMVRVQLGEDERNERARQQAAEQVKLDELLEKKRSHNREWNEQILQMEATISQLAKEAESGEAWVPAQTGMFEEESGSNDTGDDGDEPPNEPPARKRRARRGARNGAEAAA